MPSIRSLCFPKKRCFPLMMLAAAELLFLLFTFGHALRPLSSYEFTPAALEDWTTDTPLTTDAEGRVGVGTPGAAAEETLFSTPPLTLDAGYYHVTVRYRAQGWLNADNNLSLPSLSSYTEQAATLCTYEGHLDPAFSSQTLDLCARHTCTDARLLLRNNGAVFYLESLSITPNRAMMLLLALGAVLLVLAADLLLLLVWQGSPLALSPTAGAALLGGVGIVFLACLPLLQNNGGMVGDDLAFHLQRIDSIAASLSQGEFPVRLYHNAKSGYGYASSLYYGELLLYLPALLHLLGADLRLAYQLYIAGVTIATVAVAYACLREIFGRRWLALLGCALYVLAPYRLVCIYERAAVGEYTAFLFLPLIALGLWRLYTARPVPAWGVLAVGFGGLLQTHVITLVLSTLTVLLLVLVLWRRTFRPFVLLQWVRAAVSCVLVNLWFLLPFLSVAGGQLSHQGEDLTAAALSVAQLFTRGSTAAFGLALPLGGALLLALCLLVPAAPGTSRKPGLWALAIGAFALFASTRLFPWSWMPRLPVIGSLLCSIQFPWRFLGLATIALTLATLAGLQQLQLAGRGTLVRAGAGAVAVLTAIFCLTFLPEYVSQEDNSYTGDISEFVLSPSSRVTLTLDNLYLPRNAQESGLGFAAAEPSAIQVDDIVRDGRTTTVTCSTGADEGFVELPLLYYPGYRTDTGTLYASETGLVGLAVPADFSGTVTVTWQEPKRWLAADLVSLLSLVALAGRAAVRRRQKPSA